MVNNSDSKPTTAAGARTNTHKRPAQEEESPPPIEAAAAAAAESVAEGALDHNHNDDADDGQPQDSYDYTQQLGLALSRSLHRKVVQLARDEGVTVEEFVSELVAEGVVIRAWEIAERKSAMRGGQGNYPSNNNSGSRQSQPQGGMPQRNSSGGGGGGGHNSNRKGYRGMSQNRYQNIMEDKASFVEYVRSQERKR